MKINIETYHQGWTCSTNYILDHFGVANPSTLSWPPVFLDPPLSCCRYFWSVVNGNPGFEMGRGRPQKTRSHPPQIKQHGCCMGVDVSFILGVLGLTHMEHSGSCSTPQRPSTRPAVPFGYILPRRSHVRRPEADLRDAGTDPALRTLQS